MAFVRRTLMTSCIHRDQAVVTQWPVKYKPGEREDWGFAAVCFIGIVCAMWRGCLKWWFFSFDFWCWKIGFFSGVHCLIEKGYHSSLSMLHASIITNTSFINIIVNINQPTSVTQPIICLNVSLCDMAPLLKHCYDMEGHNKAANVICHTTHVIAWQPTV